MSSNESPRRIVICMGSSCFVRGNNRNAERIMALAREAIDKGVIQVSGTLCQNRCKQGPNLEIDGECHCGVDAESLPQLLESALGIGTVTGA
jgi:NADH:ubiquinone oxidoreductase subunit E